MNSWRFCLYAMLIVVIALMLEKALTLRINNRRYIFLSAEAWQGFEFFFCIYSNLFDAMKTLYSVSASLYEPVSFHYAERVVVALCSTALQVT